MSRLSIEFVDTAGRIADEVLFPVARGYANHGCRVCPLETLELARRWVGRGPGRRAFARGRWTAVTCSTARHRG